MFGIGAVLFKMINDHWPIDYDWVDVMEICTTYQYESSCAAVQ